MSQKSNGGQHIHEVDHVPASQPGPRTSTIEAKEMRPCASVPGSERKGEEMTVPEAGTTNQKDYA